MKFINDYGTEQKEIDEERALFLIERCYKNPQDMLNEIKTETIPGLRLMGSYLTLKKGDRQCQI